MPMDFRICNALKIKPFQALLRNTPFCSLGEVGGSATAKPNDCRRSSADIFAVRMKRTKAGAKIQTVKGFPLTVWIGGMDVERGLFFVIGYGIIFPSTNR